MVCPWKAKQKEKRIKDLEAMLIEAHECKKLLTGS